MARKTPKQAPPKVAPEVLQPPRHKHKGTLGATMRQAHNAKRMETLRSMKKD